MIQIKYEIDQKDKPYVALWYEGDIVMVLEDWEDIDNFMRELLDCGAAAWPETHKDD